MKRESNTPAIAEQERIKRLERRYLVLSITVLLLAVFGVALAFRCIDILNTFEFLTERLNFIRQQVDAISQSIQSLQ